MRKVLSKDPRVLGNGLRVHAADPTATVEGTAQGEEAGLGHVGLQCLSQPTSHWTHRYAVSLPTNFHACH